MLFPNKPYGSIAEYAGDYLQTLSEAVRSVDADALTRAAEILSAAYADGRWVYACGNGGSAAISGHLTRDHVKGVRTDTTLLPRVSSLASNVELLTAIANDFSYDDVFLYQLQGVARPGDVLISISSLGDSENIVRAVDWARANGVHTISMTGFDGGRSSRLAEVNLHVQGDNYGVIEDVHQSLMHILAQFIRQAHMADGDIATRKF